MMGTKQFIIEFFQIVLCILFKCLMINVRKKLHIIVES